MPQSQSYVDTDVREVFETYSIEETQSVQKKINHEIERKREELRMLVGERYRDLIDAADTIGTMRTSSVKVFQKLGALRSTFHALPNHLSLSPSKENLDNHKNKLKREELEIAVELKLSLDIPREVQNLLEKDDLIPALHLTLLLCRRLVCNEDKYKWTFLEGTSGSLSDSSNAVLESILEFCDVRLTSINTSYQKVSECILVKHIITESPVESILSWWLGQKVRACQSAIGSQDWDFLELVTSTMQALYQIFIDPAFYNTTTKGIRKCKLDPSSFGFRFTPRVISEYNHKTIPVEEPPRVTRLAQIIRDDIVTPLQALLNGEAKYLTQFVTLVQLAEYRRNSTMVLKEHCEDLMRIVLGPSTSIWNHVFHPVFQQRAERVAKRAVDEIMIFLKTIGYPKYQTMDSTFDLVGFIWKPSTDNSDGATTYDNLKMKCLTPSLSQLCEDLEFRFSELYVDYQALGDHSLKEFISTILLEVIDGFVLEAIETNPAVVGEKGSASFGRFASGIVDLCPTLWKLLEKNDATKLRNNLVSQSERCWQSWTEVLLETFKSKLEAQMSSLTPEIITSFMPMGEIYEAESGEGGEKFVPSVRIPVELTHTLHSLLFSICIEVAKVGPQAIPKSVKDSLRVSLAKTIIAFYEKLSDSGDGEAGTATILTPQISLQFIFDLKFIQWFHSSLSGTSDSLVLKLKNFIDPFDWDIVNPRVTSNLKRFLFENQLTLGLLFSEESHGFIAQNFKTKQSLSFPMPSRHLLYNQLPLLPV